MPKSHKARVRITNKAIGDRLEDAVERIEKHVLQQYKSLGKVHFERNKIEVVAGVPYETDLYVQFQLPATYESVFIFECKNWQKCVGHREVSACEDTLNAFGAQRGYLVAKSFSKHAETRRSQCPRVHFLLATELPVMPSFIPFQHISMNDSERRVFAMFSGRDGQPNSEVLPSSTISVRGVEQSVGSWIKPLVDSALVRAQGARRDVLPEGEGCFTGEEHVTFEEGEAFVDGRACLHVTVRVEQPFRCSSNATMSGFVVEGRGAALELTSHGADGIYVGLSLVSSPLVEPK